MRNKRRLPFNCTCKVPRSPAPGYTDVMLDLLQVETLEPGGMIRSSVKYGTNLVTLLYGKLTRFIPHKFDEEPCITSEFTPVLSVMHPDGKNISFYGKAKFGGEKYVWVEIIIPQSRGYVYITFCVHKDRTDDALVVIRTPGHLR